VSSDGSGERRLGVEAIPAKGGAGVESAPVRASGGGGEATGQGNLDGVARLGGIPVGNGSGRSVLRGGRRSNAVGRRGECGRVCSGTGSQKRGKRVEKGRATAVLWIAAARWRPVSTSGAPWHAYGKTPGRHYGGGQR
jgi:hypothetical protein